MSTTVTVVDPFKGTVIVETDRDVEVFLGSQTSIKVGGRSIEEGIATAAMQPAETIIRTPEPADQTLKATVIPEDGPEEELIQEGREIAKSIAADDRRRELDPPTNTCLHCQDYGTGASQYHDTLDCVAVDHTHPEAIKRDDEAREASQDALDAPEPEKSDESPETSSELKLDGPAPRKKAIKTCAKPGCGVQFEGANRQMYCGDHKTGAGKVKLTDSNGHPTADTPLPKGHWWCIHHQAQTTHRSPECPLLEQKSPQQIAAEASEAAGTGEAFTDPWNCGRCREEQHLCKLHRSLAASGSKPPLGI